VPTHSRAETAAIGLLVCGGERTLAVGRDLVHSHIAELRADRLDPPTSLVIMVVSTA
jgi:hypothetical protein